MFERWRRARRARGQEPVVPTQAEEAPRAGAEDGAGPAVAGPAEDEAPARGTPPPAPRRWSAAERRLLVGEFASSQEDARTFAERHGVAYSTFTAWLRAERRRATECSPYSRRFTADERRAAVEAFAKSGRKREDFARLWGCSPSSLDKWRRRYRDEGPKGLETRRPCRRAGRPHPNRLPDQVRELAVRVAREHPDYGAVRVADHLERFHAVRMSKSACRSILREHGVPGQPAPKVRARRKSQPPRRFERARPGQLWQSDITSFVLRRQGRRVYLTVFLDDHSRFVVAWALATHHRGPLVGEALLEGIARFGKPDEVLTDQGPQYFAWRGKSAFQKLLEREGIRHVVSRTHHPQTLGKCERLWKTVGDEFWDRAKPADLEDARRRLGHWMRHYNLFRPHQGIEGLVPADRFFGAASAVREALERECSANELRLAIDEAPRRSVYLTGQIGSQRIALHGERGRLLVDTPDGGRRELSLEELGSQPVEAEEQRDDDERERGDGREDAGGDGEPRDGAATPDADGSQADGVSQGAAAGLAGAGAVGERAGGGEGACAPDLHEDPGVLAGEEEQAAGGARAGREWAAGVAAQPAGAVGDDGGALEAAAAPREPGGLRASGGSHALGASPADRDAGEGAGADGGPGAGAANGPVAERGDGVLHVGRKPSWKEAEQAREEGGSRERSEHGSGRCSGAAEPRGWRWRWWLRRTE